MNEQLQTSLAELINKSVSGIDKAQDFLTAETPDVVQQLLMWRGIKSGVLFIVGALLLLVCIPTINKISFKLWKKWGLEDINSDPGFSFIVAATVIHIVAFVISLILINLQWLQIWIAPKVWLIEYAAKMIK